MDKLKVAVLISGGGTNLQSLINACSDSDFPAEIVLVLSNKPDVYGLVRAQNADIRTSVINNKDYKSRKEFDSALHDTIKDSGANFICLAGFMRILTEKFVEKWSGRMINIHPSLLPSFKGANAHEDVINAGVKISGCTVHFVIPEMDSGEIIVQSAVPVFPDDTPKTLGERVLKEEHKCYPEAIKLVAEKLL